MFLTHLKIAWRNLTANKGYTFINLFGLVLGFTSVLLLALYINDEFAYNSNFKNKDRIARVFQTQEWNGETYTGPSLPRPIERAFNDKYRDYFEYIVMSSWGSQHYLKFNETVILSHGQSIQEDGPKLFDLNITKGSIEGLKDVHSIMISQTTAASLFGNENPLGKTINIDGKTDMQVTAVYEDLPYNSSFYHLHFITPWKYYVNSQKWIKESLKYWDSNSFQMYVRLRPNIDFQSAEEAIRYTKRDAMDLGDDPFPKLHIFKMDDWKLRDRFENGKQTGGLIQVVYFLIFICFIILGLASINFMNLSTARAQKRAKEVGVKKTIGGQRKDLIKQFFGETFIVVLIAFVLSIVLVNTLLEPFNTIVFKEIKFPWLSMLFWGICLVVLVLVTFLSGAYPALFLSSLNPNTVLKGWNQKGKSSGLVRKILVCFQFVVSTGLIVITIVINRQMKYCLDRDIGYNPTGIMQIDAGKAPFLKKFDVFREHVMKTGAVENIVCSQSPINAVYNNRSGFTWEGKPDDLEELFQWVVITPDYMKTLQIEVVKGREFSRAIISDTTALLINKKAVEFMGVEDPIGLVIRDDGDEEEDQEIYKVIGVVDDVLMESPFSPKRQVFYAYNTSGAGTYIMRLNPNNSDQENLEKIQKAYEEIFPNLPLEYNFAVDEHAKKFNEFRKVSNMIFFFTLLAIFISCLGLLGLTSFIAEQRTKEIGIRKSIGSSVFGIWKLLAKDFIILVFISFSIALPIAYKIGNLILEDFEYRTSFSYGYLFFGAFFTLLIAMVTVSYHAIKTASADPVKSLKTE